MKFWSLILAITLLVMGANADAAKRFGGGKSMGQQSSNVTKQQAPAAPAAAPNAAAAKPAPAAPVAAPKKPWGAMLGGLAAGLGLAWLAHSLGMGEAFGQMLMFGLLALGIMMAVGWFMRRRNAAQSGAESRYAMQGAGPMSVSPSQYKIENVGNDSSARPWERSYNPLAASAGGSGGSMIGSAIGTDGLAGSQNWGVPEGFDTQGFLNSAKQNFITLQAAWDKSDISNLRSMMTDSMLAEIKAQLAEREQHTGAGVNHTEVAMLDAKLLGIEDLGTAWMASVEFSGMIKEDPTQSPGPFREVWNMTKLKTGVAGWLVAGVQALQ
jgi:predicted lipid-binding transport protein (Tim44 family)